jgi:perosamine synthetase
MNSSDEDIPVAAPCLIGHEHEYVMDCLESSWISSAGDYVEKFEKSFAGFCEVDNAISCANGTAALHLALEALDIGQGDEVIVPDLTFVATANAVSYTGAEPVLADITDDTWNLDPDSVQKKINSQTAAIIPVHLYGHPVDMDPICKIAMDHDLYVIEDAAEAHGGIYKGQKVGSIGDVATFSFYGNKILTTGEGGMVTTDDDELAAKIRQLRGQGMDPNRRYWFPVIGYNYRMTNIQAAIGLAQVEDAQWHLSRRRKIASWYRERLADISELSLPVEKEWAKNVYWIFNVVIEDSGVNREVIRDSLSTRGIETRPFFYPIHTLPPYSNSKLNDDTVSSDIAARGISLPTWAGLSEADVERVCAELVDCLR